MTASAYAFERPARTPRNIRIVLVVLFGLLALRVAFGAAWGVLLVGAVLVLPAMWDMLRNRVSKFAVNQDAVTWVASTQSGKVPLIDITKAVIDTRLDLSARLTLHLTDGGRIRVPSDAVPPKDALAQALMDHDIKVERNAFALL